MYIISYDKGEVIYIYMYINNNNNVYIYNIGGEVIQVEQGDA